MKPIYYNTLLSLGLIAAITLGSCQQKNEDKKETVQNHHAHPKADVQDTISLKTFELWRTNWAKHGSEHVPVNYYTMPSIDLVETLGEGAKRAALFNGLDMTTDVPVLHLMIVGVDSTDHLMLDYSKGQYVYDVSYSCPFKCDVQL